MYKEKKAISRLKEALLIFFTLQHPHLDAGSTAGDAVVAAAAGAHIGNFDLSDLAAVGGRTVFDGIQIPHRLAESPSTSFAAAMGFE